MPFGREIWLRHVKCLRALGDLFHFTFRVSGKFHNDRRSLFHIRRIFHFTILPLPRSRPGPPATQTICPRPHSLFQNIHRRIIESLLMRGILRSVEDPVTRPHEAHRFSEGRASPPARSSGRASLSPALSARRHSSGCGFWSWPPPRAAGAPAACGDSALE